MSGSGVDQPAVARNDDPPPFGRQSSAPTYRQSLDGSSSPFEVSPIEPPSTYAFRSGLDQARSASTNHLSSGGQSTGRPGHDYPEPDDYYRPHEDDVSAGSSSMAARYSGLNDRVSPLPASVPGASRPRQPAYRSTSDSPTLGGSSLNGTAAARSMRSRQPSFKDLINRFNNAPDQVLPLPSVSRSTSRAASPSGSVDGSDRSRTLPRRRLPDSPTATSHASNPRPRVESRPSLPETEAAVIPPPLFQRVPESHPRRPFFGEVLSINTQLNNSGSLVPPQLRRRSSDGSIPSPSPVFLESTPGYALSPLTPTAWYLGQASSLEAVQPGTNRAGSHRRVRSDVVGDFQGPSLAEPWNPTMAVSAPLQPAKAADGSPVSPNSRSRIPISSHRSGTASVPESPSNPNFSSRFNAIPLAPRGTSRLPKPSPKNSPTRMAGNVPVLFASTSRGSRDTAIGRTRSQVPEPSRHLQALISPPPPKKSPPLRSSRPRQLVSQAGPTSPRSIGERVSSFQKHADRENEARSPRARQRRLPELGNVDFETRRQRIQQAFNRTVQENERREEQAAELRRRASERIELRGSPRSPTDEQVATPSTAVADTPVAPNMATASAASTVASTSDDKEQRIVPQLHLNTGFTIPESNDPHTTMDSPTLGMPNDQDRVSSGASHDLKPPKDTAVPDSAVTTDSDGTHVTHFDPEPQSGLLERRLSASHDTLLSHIMQIRKSSSSDSCDEPDCSMSENDEKESIQIMLRGSTYLNSPSSTDTEEARPAPLRHSQNTNPPQPRWSMSSWSSSAHNRNSTSCDEHCDEDDNGDNLILHEQPTAPATESCSAASTRPPSMGDYDPSSPLQDLGIMGPDTLETSQRPSSNQFSTPPSLARQGRWDSRRVTQLYLEELTRGRGANATAPPARASPSLRLHESEPRTHSQTNSLTDDPVIIPGFQDVPLPSRNSHSASLVGRDDWEHASPSIMDWMQIAAGNEPVTPGHENPTHVTDGAPTPRVMTATAALGDSSKLDSGLGLSVNNFPLDEFRPSAGGPPGGPVQPNRGHANRYSHADGATNSTGSSEDSSFRRLEPTHSFPAADSSATSLAPSAEHPMLGELRKSPSPEQRRLKKRRHVIKELVDTEYTFGRDMKVVDDIYKGTSNSCLDLSVEDVKILFANSDQVVQFSMSFQDALKNAARSIYIMPKSQRWGSKRSARNNRPGSSGGDEQLAVDAGKSDLEKDRATGIGGAFLANMEQMEKVYADYLRNHDAANKKLQVLQSNPKVAIWLKECREWAADLTGAWDLDSLLVKPVQRILKYPLLLSELLESTPKDHPDYLNLATALKEVTNISVRINEMKKRADLVGQVVGRKRKESDVRAGLSKAFGRRTEKFRQQVGLSDMFEDKEYDALSQRFGDGFFQLQVVMRDVEMYVRETQSAMDQFDEFASSIEGVIDAYQSSYVELESKWRRFRVSVREIMTVALPEHLGIVRKNVIDPMVALLKLHEAPQRVMKKRDKRLLDFARFKAVSDRGDKPDKKTKEQGEAFQALNDTLKDELPKLYALTAKLMGACLMNFVDIQTVWWNVLQKKVGAHVESFPDDLQKVISDWSCDFNLSEAQVLSLGICNGALLADTVNLVNFNTPSTGTNVNSPRRPSTVNSSIHRPGSMTEDSPKVSHDYGVGQLFQSPQVDGQSGTSRHRADSSFSARAPSESPDVGRSQLLQQVTNSSSSNSQTSRPTEEEAFPSLPQLSLDTPFLADVINVSSHDDNPPTSPAGRYSGFFSSAMPMSDAPTETEGPQNQATHVSKEPKVLFLAASIYEFNIDRSRREAGYPYLTYVAGEIFDVIGEKGELWLARNQDDSTHQVGWIWNKHFAKLSS
ncbi:hypothetical protein N7492_003766 [Penicillium capsulatum]|uniref:Dynamin-binding protein n=1 Tax=Penicillium capsulatum TaxID=69766 RepID=A0A9W9IRS1_9EURO|nr:hypothetical protein N7492_003766 [Penicillium capsulatum]KAJ6121652.1 hypothetical protein N7512_004117 [Penicillium capsulatum]